MMFRPVLSFHRIPALLPMLLPALIVVAGMLLAQNAGAAGIGTEVARHAGNGRQGLDSGYIGIALMALGIGLLLAEATVPTFGALAVGGGIAFLGGLAMLLHGTAQGFDPGPGVIAGIVVVFIGLLALVLWLLLRARRARIVSGEQQMLDATGQLLEAVPAGGDGWALVYGERWRIRARIAMDAGTTVRVTRRDGLLLWVEPMDRRTPASSTEN